MTEFRRVQGKSYMVLSVDGPAEGYEYPMLEQNRILGLLPFHLTYADGTPQLWYDISGKQSLDDWVRMKKPGSEFLKLFLTALTETLEQAGEHLLKENGLSLSPECIFLNIDSKELACCYTPFQKKPFMDALRGFMEYYLSHMEHNNGDGTKKCYEVYEKCQKEHLALEELLSVLFEEKLELKEELETTEEPGVIREDVQIEPYAEGPSKFFSLSKAFRSHMRRFTRTKRAQEQAYAFDPEEGQAETANPTVLLGSEAGRTLGELKYEGMGNEKNIVLSSEAFLIGSQREDVDGYITNETVSRMHARITKEGDAYYLEDLNSTNGTYLNGERLSYREKVKIQKNDKISFATERFWFV